jgi:hypothetical protein
MERFNLEEILRYLTIGFVSIGLLFICGPEEVTELVKELGSVGIPLAAFTIGVLIYFTYRGTIYTFFINPVKDLLTTYNYRVFLKNNYNVESFLQVEIIWYVLRDLYLKKVHQGIRVNSSGIHLLYMSALLFDAASIYCILVQQETKAFYLVISSLVLGISGLLTDIFVERHELLILKNIEPSKLKEAIDRMRSGDMTTR